MKKGVVINKKDRCNEIALFIASSDGHKNIVKYLVEKGVDINKENEYGWTPLHKACFDENENMVNV